MRSKNEKSNLPFFCAHLFPSLFLVFLAANSFLSYGHLPAAAKAWVMVLGLLLPLLLGIRESLRGKGPDLDLRSAGAPAIPAGLWFLLLGLIAAAYSFKLTDFPSWILPDEARNAYFSNDLSERWDWRLAWGEGQTPPFFAWAFGLFLKIVPLSILSMRLFPVLILLATVACTYPFARRFLSAELAFAWVWVLALSFWPFTFSRFCMGMGSFLLLQCLSILSFLSFWTAKSAGQGRGALWGLAATAALQIYTGPQGNLSIGMAWGAVFLALFFFGKGGRKDLLVFSLPLLVLSLPMLWREAFHGGSHYILAQFHPGLNLDYIKALFWDGQGSAPFGPAWGGFFNPILTSLMLLGGLGILRGRAWFLGGWILGCCSIFLLAGLLTSHLESERVQTLIPFLLFMALLGSREVLAGIPTQGRLPVLLVLLAASSGLDLYHYIGPYQSLPGGRTAWRNPNFQAAYLALRADSRAGMKLGLMDLTTIYDDRTLEIMVYPFNALRHPGARVVDLQEIALVTNPNYEPFLKERFPKGRWQWFCEPGSTTRGLLLGRIPVDAESRETLERWVRAEEAFHRVKAMYLYRDFAQDTTPFQKYLASQTELFRKDPFLMSIYWEWGGLHALIQGDMRGADDCYRKALEDGYRAAHLYHDRGVALVRQGLYPQARLQFEKAGKAPVNRTTSQYLLQWLDQTGH